MAERSPDRAGPTPAMVWLWAGLTSLLLHGALLGWAFSLRVAPAAKKTRVVTVEPITLTHLQPRPSGGGGSPGPPAASPPAATQLPPTPPKPKPKPKPKARELPPKPERQELTEVPPALALPRPAPVVSPGRTGSQSAAATVSPSGGGGGGGGTGGGTGGGRGPGTGPGEGPGAGGGTLLQGYLREVRRLLERQKEYPKMAQRLNLQGVTVLHFSICADGRIEVTRIARSSGHDILDRAAEDTVRRVGRFPPFPPGLGRDRLSIEIPLAFRLTQD